MGFLKFLQIKEKEFIKVVYNLEILDFYSKETFKIAKTFNRNTRGNVQTLTDNDFQSKS